MKEKKRNKKYEAHSSIRIDKDLKNKIVKIAESKSMPYTKLIEDIIIDNIR